MNVARFTGGTLVLTAAALFVGFTFADPGFETDDTREFAQHAVEVAGRAPGIVVAQAIQILLAALTVLAGVSLYLLVRRSAPGLGLAGLLMLVLTGVMSAVEGMVGVAMVSASQTYADGGLVAAGEDQTLELINTLGRIHWASWLGVAVLLGLAAVTFGYAMAWPARFIPRWLGGIGITGGVLLALVPLTLVHWVFFFGLMLGMLLVLGWLLVTAIWLIARASRIEAEVVRAYQGQGTPLGT